MPTDTTSAQPPDPILTGPDAARRLLLLSDLQTALAGLGIRSVLARTHRIVLRPPAAQCDPSGQVNPRLHIFTPAGTAIATTDGTAYHPRQRPRLPRSRPRRRSHPHPRPRRRSDGSRALTARTAMTTDNTTPTPTPTREPGNRPAPSRRRVAAVARTGRAHDQPGGREARMVRRQDQPDRERAGHRPAPRRQAPARHLRCARQRRTGTPARPVPAIPAESWWHHYGVTVPDWFQPYAALEADAAILRSYHPELIPALLQTPAYRHAIRDVPPGPDSDELAALLHARQHRLADTRTPHLHWILSEAVIRRTAGTAAVMAAQLTCLTDASHQPGITIQVLPFHAGAHPAMDSPFTILTFPDPGNPGIVFAGSDGTLCLDGGHYLQAFTRLQDMALPPQDSRLLIAQVADELAQQPHRNRHHQ